MMCSVGCWTWRLAVPAIAAIWLSACGMAGSEERFVPVCPPVVEYSDGLQERAAAELDLLPEDSVIAAMLGDYAVMRDQARSGAIMSAQKLMRQLYQFRNLS